jgi:plasmid replication initiation protein
MYAKININIQNQFDSAYALALYENCYRFHKVGTTGPIDLDVWRELLGAQAAVYDEFKYFKQRVLTPAIDRVNAVSNVTLDMKTIREGRKVIALKFNVAEKAQKTLDEVPGDPDDVIRETEAFKLLSKCNIGARLAIQWIRSDPQKALRVARDTLERDAKRQIKTNMAGYARASFENGDVTDVEDTAAQQEQQDAAREAAREAEREKDRRAGAANSADAELTTEERKALQAEFIAATPGAKVSPRTGRIGGTHAIAFKSYVLKRAPEVIASRQEA